MTIMVAESTPSRDTLGAINGLSGSASSLARAIAPVGATSLFAYTVSTDALGGSLVWLVMTLVSASAYALSYKLAGSAPAWRREPARCDAESPRADDTGFFVNEDSRATR